MTAPATLDAAGIAARIPHADRMALLHALRRWDATSIDCTAIGHDSPAHPLRTSGGLLAPAAIEMAAQAMALHGRLIADAASHPDAERAAPAAGYIASVRQVRLHRLRLDEAAGPLAVHAERLSGDASQVMYAFTVAAADGQPLAQGRAVVVLDTPLVAPTALGAAA